MYGDMIICTRCNKTFKDTWTNHDSRTEKVQINCPFCLSDDVINASEFIDKYESMNKYETGGGKKEYGEKYKILKRIYKLFIEKNKKMLVQKKIFYPTDVIKRWEEHDKLHEV